MKISTCLLLVLGICTLPIFAAVGKEYPLWYLQYKEGKCIIVHGKLAKSGREEPITITIETDKNQSEKIAYVPHLLEILEAEKIVVPRGVQFADRTQYRGGQQLTCYSEMLEIEGLLLTPSPVPDGKPHFFVLETVRIGSLSLKRIVAVVQQSDLHFLNDLREDVPATPLEKPID